MCNQCCCYSKPILDVADNKFAESAALLMLNPTVDSRPGNSGWVEEGRNTGPGQEKPCWVFAHLLSPLETSARFIKGALRGGGKSTLDQA